MWGRKSWIFMMSLYPWKSLSVRPKRHVLILHPTMYDSSRHTQTGWGTRLLMIERHEEF